MEARVIKLKTWPEQFNAVAEHSKTFEWRKEDRVRFEVGDHLELREFEPCAACDGKGTTLRANVFGKTPSGFRPEPVTCETCAGSKGRETGRWIAVRVIYILRGSFGIPPGYVVMSFNYVGQGRD